MDENEEWEYGFYDSKFGPEPIWWYVFGLPHKTADSAKHAGEKTVWWRAVIVRRRPAGMPTTTRGSQSRGRTRGDSSESR